MIQIRNSVFETNSSSTHTLVIGINDIDDYLPYGRHIKIHWIDTDDYQILETLEEKLSYLISHIANKLKYSCNNYEELLEEINENYEYNRIKKFILNIFDKEIRFPDNSKNYYDDIEDIVEINHQLIPWSTNTVAESVIDELIKHMQNINNEHIFNSDADIDSLSFEDKLYIYFENKTYIIFGRD